MNAPGKRSEKGSKKLTRRSDGPTVLVIDQSRRRLKTRLGHGWFKRGERAIVEVSEQWEATKLLGALSEDGETRSCRCESNFTSEVTIHFLRSLQEEFGEDLIVVLDNAPYFTSKKVRKFAEGGGIDLCYLPRYSPQMNPVEECWRQLNQQLKNRWFDDIDHLNRAIQKALQVANPPSMFNYLYP
jgi:transposase